MFIEPPWQFYSNPNASPVPLQLHLPLHHKLRTRQANGQRSWRAARLLLLLLLLIQSREGERRDRHGGARRRRAAEGWVSLKGTGRGLRWLLLMLLHVSKIT